MTDETADLTVPRNAVVKRDGSHWPTHVGKSRRRKRVRNRRRRLDAA